MRVAILVAAVLLASTSPVGANETPMTASASAQPASATMADIAWLEGSWIGTGIDGQPSGEAYSRAGDNSIVGHFWQLDAGGMIAFAELITIVPRDGGLVMRLKHFDQDMTGWEAKEGAAALEFVLTQNGPDRWVFGPVELVPVAPDRLETSVRVRDKAGPARTLRFSYRRTPPVK